MTDSDSNAQPAGNRGDDSKGGFTGLSTVALNGAALVIIWVIALAAGTLFPAPEDQIVAAGAPLGLSVAVAVAFGQRAFGGVAAGLILSIMVLANLPLMDAAVLTGAGAAATFAASLATRAPGGTRFPTAPVESVRLCMLAVGLPVVVMAPATLLLDMPTQVLPPVQALLGSMAAAILMSLPLLLALMRPPPPRQNTHDGEGLVTGALLLIVLMIGFGATDAATSPLRHLPVGLVMPLLVWAAIRLPVQAAGLAIAVVGGAITVGTVLGRGPFVTEAGGSDIAMASLLACIVGAITMTVTAHAAEAEALRRALRPTKAPAGEQMRKVRELLDAAPLAAAVSSLDGAVRYANRRQSELYGCAGRDLTGADTWRFFVDPRDRQAMLGLLNRHGRVDAYEYRLRRPDGTEVWVEESWAPVQVDDQTGILAWSTDISERKQAEETLRSSERRLRAILDDSPVAVTISRPGGRIIYANPKAAAMVALPRALVIGSDGREFYAVPEQRDHMAQVMNTGGAVINEEITLMAADGSRRTVVFTLLPMEYDGAEAHLAWSFDITARKKAEEQLRSSERRLRAIIGATPLAMAVLRLGGRLRYANVALLRQFGFSATEARRLRPESLFEDPDVPRHLADELSTGAAPRNIEARMRRRDGSSFWALLSFAHGEFEGRAAVFVWATDITERMEAATAMARHRDELERAVHDGTRELAKLNEDLQRELEERERAEARVQRGQTYLRAVLDTVADGIITVNNRGMIEEFNPAAERIFGYNRAECIGQNIAMLMPQPEAERHDGYLSRYLEEGNPRVIGRRREFFGRRKNGDLFPLYLVVTETEVEGRALYTGLLRDITDQREAEEALLAAKEEAELANRTKSEFLANMSHELRTPLNAIIGFSEMMQSGILGQVEPPTYRGYIDNIHESGRHLLDVINDILDISRIEAGRMNLYEEDFSIAEVVGDCLKLVQPRADVAGLTLRADLPDSPPMLHGDERRIKQIGLNLLANAVKFTPEGGTVTIGLTVRDDADPPGEDGFDWGVKLWVRDTGIGMTQEDCARVMAPFVQADTGLSRRYEGTGLGLPLVAALGELHGARLRLTSQIDHGTTAEVWFPRGRVVEPGAPTAADEPA